MVGWQLVRETVGARWLVIGLVLVIERRGTSLLATSLRIVSFNWWSSTMRNFLGITPHHEYTTLLDARRGKERSG